MGRSRTARLVQAILLLVGAGSSIAAVVDYFAPGMDGVGSVLVLLSPVLLAVAGPYALHWFIVRAPLVAVPSAAGFAVWGLSFATDVFAGRTPTAPLFSWFFLVIAQTLAVAGCAVASGLVSGIAAGARRARGSTGTTTAPPADAPQPGIRLVLAAGVSVLLLVGGVVVSRELLEPRPSRVPVLPPAVVTDQPAGVAVDGTFEATPRSIAYEGDIVGLQELHLRGDLDVAVWGVVTDGRGRTLGAGRLTGRGDRLDVTGNAMVLRLETEVHVTTDGVRAPNVADGSSVATIAADGPVEVRAAELRFQGPAGDEVAISGGVATVAFATGSGGGAVAISGDGPTRFVDLPSELALSAAGSERATLSWAGPGAVDAGRRYEAEHVGIKTTPTFEATLTTSPVAVRGTGRFAQLYLDNVPQLRARGGVRVKDTGVRAERGKRGAFDWAPENAGDTDLVISRIVPANDDARWLSLGLDVLPDLCGGEPSCPRYGGDTRGFHEGRPINAVILPRTGDEREVRFLVPDDAAPGPNVLRVVFEGNFDPITVEIPVAVDD